MWAVPVSVAVVVAKTLITVTLHSLRGSKVSEITLKFLSGVTKHMTEGTGEGKLCWGLTCVFETLVVFWVDTDIDV